MFDTLKAVICYPEQPYLVKRAYLRLLFEVFINKIPDPKIKVDNENVDSEEISEILNSEIIPQLDAKNILFYLEGLVNRTDDKELLDLRNQIKSKQKQYLNEAKQDVNNQGKKPRILEDEKEFWKYLMSNGVIQFLSDTYDERIKEIEQE